MGATRSNELAKQKSFCFANSFWYLFAGYNCVYRMFIVKALTIRDQRRWRVNVCEFLCGSNIIFAYLLYSLPQDRLTTLFCSKYWQQNYFHEIFKKFLELPAVFFKCIHYLHEHILNTILEFVYKGGRFIFVWKNCCFFFV